MPLSIITGSTNNSHEFLQIKQSGIFISGIKFGSPPITNKNYLYLCFFSSYVK